MNSSITLLVALAPSELRALQQHAATLPCSLPLLMRERALDLARSVENASARRSAPPRLWALPKDERTELQAITFSQAESDAIQLAALAFHFVLPGETLRDVTAADFVAEAALARVGDREDPAAHRARSSR